MDIESTIKDRITQLLSPENLEVINDSHKHIGHVGSKNGAGHFTVIIKSNDLAQQTRIVAHRKVYDVLQDLIPEKIHALNIKVIK